MNFENILDVIKTILAIIFVGSSYAAYDNSNLIFTYENENN